MEPQQDPTTTASSAEKTRQNERDMLEPGEHVITEVRRHPIGVIAIYLEATAAIVAIVAITALGITGIGNNLSSQTRNLIIVGVFLIVLLVAAILFVAVYIYHQSRMLVTDRSLVQILQRGLFNRKVSRLSMSNVEDVSADQQGLLPTMLNYGTLTVQTAGEEDNFIFPWCPKPNIYAERILEARQAYAQSVRQASAPSQKNT